MFFSFNQAKQWLENNQLILASFVPANFILCPSFDVLAYTVGVATKNYFLLGAQDCSEHASGAYTGQICAQSLANIGCTYCLVGHSEQRQFLTNTIISNKLKQLQQCNITPILCVSSASPEQLEPAQKFISHYPTKKLLIAYEPVESIGTGQVATKEAIIAANQLITQYLSQKAPYQILYGGSILPDNIAMLKTIDSIDGFLIGKASTDIKKLTAIITE